MDGMTLVLRMKDYLDSEIEKEDRELEHYKDLSKYTDPKVYKFMKEHVAFRSGLRQAYLDAKAMLDGEGDPLEKMSLVRHFFHGLSIGYSDAYHISYDMVEKFNERREQS